MAQCIRLIGLVAITARTFVKSVATLGTGCSNGAFGVAVGMAGILRGTAAGSAAGNIIMAQCCGCTILIAVTAGTFMESVTSGRTSGLNNARSIAVGMVGTAGAGVVSMTPGTVSVVAPRCLYPVMAQCLRLVGLVAIAAGTFVEGIAPFGTSCSNSAFGIAVGMAGVLHSAAAGAGTRDVIMTQCCRFIILITIAAGTRIDGVSTRCTSGLNHLRSIAMLTRSCCGSDHSLTCTKSVGVVSIGNIGVLSVRGRACSHQISAILPAKCPAKTVKVRDWIAAAVGNRLFVIRSQRFSHTQILCKSFPW